MPQITLVPTGQTFTADSTEAVLAAALRAGLNLPHSCKGGHCASCRARILAGSFVYPGPRPPGVTEHEAREGYALLCQARAITDLRIETREVQPAPDVELKSLPCRIERMDRLAEDVMAVFLRLPAVEELHIPAGPVPRRDALRGPAAAVFRSPVRRPTGGSSNCTCAAPRAAASPPAAGPAAVRLPPGIGAVDRPAEHFEPGFPRRGRFGGFVFSPGILRSINWDL